MCFLETRSGGSKRIAPREGIKLDPKVLGLPTDAESGHLRQPLRNMDILRAGCPMVPDPHLERVCLHCGGKGLGTDQRSRSGSRSFRQEISDQQRQRQDNIGKINSFVYLCQWRKKNPGLLLGALDNVEVVLEMLLPNSGFPKVFPSTNSGI